MTSGEPAGAVFCRLMMACPFFRTDRTRSAGTAAIVWTMRDSSSNSSIVQLSIVPAATVVDANSSSRS